MSDFIIIIWYFPEISQAQKEKNSKHFIGLKWKRSKNNENGNHIPRMLSGNDKERQIKPIEHASWNAINAIYVTFNGFWCLLKVKLWTIYTYLERAVGFVCACMWSCMQCDKVAKSKKTRRVLVEQSIPWSIRITVFLWFGLKPTSLCIWNSEYMSYTMKRIFQPNT